MRRKKKNVWLLTLSILSLSSFIYFINSFSPSSNLPIANYQIPIIPAFFLVFFIFLFFLSSYLLDNFRRAITIGVLICLYFTLRLFDLNNPLYIILLVALFISIELFLKKRV